MEDVKQQGVSFTPFGLGTFVLMSDCPLVRFMLCNRMVSLLSGRIIDIESTDFNRGHHGHN